MALRTPVGGIEDALLIVNSLRYSSFKNDPAAHQIPAVKAFQDIAVDFKHPVSPRLSSHALLHGLMRMGRKQQAADLAVSMMDAGMKLRAKTLQTFMRILKPPPTHPPRRIAIPPFSFTPNIRSLADIIPMAQHPSSRLALEIFTVARKTQNNPRGMFRTLITICLINAEIVLASLIFVFVMKEFQHRPALVEQPLDNTSVQVSHPPRKPNAMHLMLRRLVRPIRRIFESSGQDAETLSASLQALANIASLIDNRRLIIGDISPLLRVLYHCPRVDADVWIVDANEDAKQVNAYTYIHDVLERLITSLPTSTTFQSLRNSRPIMPPIDLHACNTLLHYSLRHRLSPAFADMILRHMVEEHSPPLQPDSTTFNILLRSGTLLQDSTLAQEAIAAHQSLSEQDSNASVSADEFHDSAIISLCQSLRSVDLTLPTSRADITKLIYSLTTHLMHYISTGRPQLASKYIFTLFPELALPMTPSANFDISRHKEARHAMVVRPSKYGPMIFHVLLNDLAKSGRTGLAKIVWNLAQRAERHSWTKLNPWVLGVEAYTCMMRCWALEYRRGVKQQREKVRVMALIGGMRCYKQMKDVREEVQRALSEIGCEYRMERIGNMPDVDARFVNATLALFKPWSGPMPSEPEVRREFEETMMRVAETGVLANGWTPVLQEIAEDMVRVGLELPPGLRHLFLGRWDEAARKRERPPQFGLVPYAYPGEPDHGWRPFTVPCIRTRGLPFGRRPRRRERQTRRPKKID
ncbi:hypothetical protein DXG03_001272 [Asterophora parasitica]|uniref:Pentatricopeptide repeat-containing protein n=1 Tax=Asterophora parasitica TaxID=117018 RepID=A0A9P7G3A4_9AGAR|nr:hypothetical protein DXG03_001272 [Asterophora parasitica]